FAAYSTNSGATNSWVRRVMLTGGPTEASKVERSLPSAYADPQATFDDFGNLYLTYLSDRHQFGTATGGGRTPPTHAGVGAAGRQWVPNMWAGRILTIRPGQAGMVESKFITSNTADTLTVGAVWTNNPAPGDAYVIRSGDIVGGDVVPGNAAVALLSTN